LIETGSRLVARRPSACLIERGMAQIRCGEFGLIKEHTREIAAVRFDPVICRLGVAGRRLFV